MRLKKLGTLFLIWGMMMLTAGAAFGQIEAYLLIDGFSERIKIDARLTDWAQISRMPDPNKVSSGTTRNGGYQEGKVAFQEFSVIKNKDKSSPFLDLIFFQGKRFPLITIELYKVEERKKPFYKIEMTTVFVSAITIEKTLDPKLEKVTFKYKRIEWKHGFPKK